MNGVVKTSLKVTGVGLIGSTLSIVAGVQTGNIVYNVTNNYDKAMAAGTLVGTGGMVATLAGMVAVTENDSAKYSDEEIRQAEKITATMNNASSGMKAMSNALKLAAFFSR